MHAARSGCASPWCDRDLLGGSDLEPRDNLPVPLVHELANLVVCDLGGKHCVQLVRFLVPRDAAEDGSDLMVIRDERRERDQRFEVVAIGVPRVRRPRASLHRGDPVRLLARRS